MKPIATYITKPDGWHELPSSMCAEPGKEDCSCNFVNSESGVQFMATIKAFPLQIIKISIAPIYSLRKDLEDIELQDYILFNSGNIIKEFFGSRKFAMAPDVPSRPDIKHFFCVLED